MNATHTNREAKAKERRRSIDEANQVRSRLVELGLLPPPAKMLLGGKQRRSFSQPTVAKVSEVLGELGGIFATFADYLGTRVDLFHLEHSLEFSKARSQNSAPSWQRDNVDETGNHWAPQQLFIEPQPFERRPLENLYRGQLRDGTVVIMRRRIEVGAHEFKQLNQLAPSVTPFMANPQLFGKIVKDFQTQVEMALDYCQVSALLAQLGNPSQEGRPFVVPKVYPELCDKMTLVYKPVSGQRMDHFIMNSRSKGGPFFDGLEAQANGYIPEEIARVLCDAWLQLTLTHGIAPVSFSQRDIIITSSNQVALLGVEFQEISKSTRDILSKYLIHSSNDDPAKALQQLRQASDSPSSIPDKELERMFRQLVPFRHGGWNDHGGINSAAETVFAQVRLLQQHGVSLKPAFVDLVRGLYSTARIARQLSPIRDSLSEGIKDIRLASLLENTREILNPIHWTAQSDKLIAMMMFAPKNFDQTIDMLTESPKLERAEPSSPWVAWAAFFCVGAIVYQQLLLGLAVFWDQLLGVWLE